ncbi:pyridoxal phosphate-dependent transferase [Zopfochytrium polystomum]|nr:pyridoxal phosphate-dependent transferase [Zopfochytrium polystomum]
MSSSSSAAAFDLQAIVRPNIWALKPYRCARDDYSTGILLDANENSFGPAIPSVAAAAASAAAAAASSASSDPSAAALTDLIASAPLERYPDPHQSEFKARLAALRGLSSPSHFFLGVGSDESIDLAVRVFCVPGKDKILTTPPTYGMYAVCAQTNDVAVVQVPLVVDGGAFQLDVPKVKDAIRREGGKVKIVFLCSPGNPTGTLIRKEDVRELLEFEEYKGIVLVDEAYIDFCEDGASVATWVEKYPNLIVTQTLSKSFGLAGIRLGISISSPAIAALFNKTKAPYNISTPTSLLANAALHPSSLSTMRANAARIAVQRARLAAALGALPRVGAILGANHANFVLAQIVDPETGSPDNRWAFEVYKRLAETLGVVVRFRGNEWGCEGCLRVSVGTEWENDVLLERIAGLLGKVVVE